MHEDLSILADIHKYWVLPVLTRKSSQGLEVRFWVFFSLVLFCFFFQMLALRPAVYRVTLEKHGKEGKVVPTVAGEI